ncbi:cytochrome P450 [Streptomyces sp. NPDC013157]|uniref:cytochrome P450 n=1 Tax=Streptomyces sp. NPDC013157 TaxID=3364861 RepID=UPI00368B4828
MLVARIMKTRPETNSFGHPPKAPRARRLTRGFARVAAHDTELGGVAIPRGARVWPLVASANRDERKGERADEFDFRGSPLDHLGFGCGTHGCAGQGVARVELHALIHALLESVERIPPPTTRDRRRPAR